VSNAIAAVQPVVRRSRAADEFSRECAELFGQAAQMFGVPPSVGQIYGLLYSSPEPLCFSEIFQRLKISKGSASQGLNLLRSLGAVGVAAPEGGNGRREYFSPELSLRKLLRVMLDKRVSPMAGRAPERLARLRHSIEGAEGKERRFLSSRVKQLDAWHRRLKAVVPVLVALLGPRS
jgi:DNA-binding transcriptional regulator GbsR (MarR family)